jgi:hypothetical protein
MRMILKKNPFQDKPTNLTYSFFLYETPAADASDDVRGRAGEEIQLGRREIYVYYPSGMANQSCGSRRRDQAPRETSTLSQNSSR